MDKNKKFFFLSRKCKSKHCEWAISHPDFFIADSPKEKKTFIIQFLDLPHILAMKLDLQMTLKAKSWSRSPSILV